jgi:hypothetical protein
MTTIGRDMLKIASVVFPLLMLTSCATLSIPDVDFAWPVESVQTVSATNRVEEVRYGFSMNVAPLSVEEFRDSTSLVGEQLHILRSHDGYYFVTGRNFMNVYVFAPSSGELKLENKLEISKEGLKNPALNQRAPYIELVDGSTRTVKLTSSEIIEGPAR